MIKANRTSALLMTALVASAILGACGPRAKIMLPTHAVTQKPAAKTEESKGKTGTGAAVALHALGADGAEKLALLEKSRVQLAGALSEMQNDTHLGRLKVLASTDGLVDAALTASDVTIIEADLTAYCTLFSAESNAVAPADGSEKICEKAIVPDAETIKKTAAGGEDNVLCKSIQAMTRLLQGSNKAVAALRADLLNNPALAEAGKLAEGGKDLESVELSKQKSEIEYYQSALSAEAQLRPAAQALIDLAKNISCPL
jgi:hypothetical protein